MADKGRIGSLSNVPLWEVFRTLAAGVDKNGHLQPERVGDASPSSPHGFISAVSPVKRRDSEQSRSSD
jgi:hypothetical protein